MMNLSALRDAATLAQTKFAYLLASKFPGADQWTWYRAMSAAAGDNVRRNDDTSRDAALAADTEIKAAHDDYIRLLHVFYTARDGAGGVLGRYVSNDSAVAARKRRSKLFTRFCAASLSNAPGFFLPARERFRRRCPVRRYHPPTQSTRDAPSSDAIHPRPCNPPRPYNPRQPYF